MRTIDNIAEYRTWRKGLKLEPGERVGFFPTMGALHEGHLVRQILRLCASGISLSSYLDAHDGIGASDGCMNAERLTALFHMHN